MAVPWESLRTAACCGRLGDPDGGPTAVTSERPDSGLSSTGVTTPPWLDTLECDVAFVMVGRQNACKHYQETQCTKMINLRYYNTIFRQVIAKLTAIGQIKMFLIHRKKILRLE